MVGTIIVVRIFFLFSTFSVLQEQEPAFSAVNLWRIVRITSTLLEISGLPNYLITHQLVYLGCFTLMLLGKLEPVTSSAISYGE